MNSFLFHSNVNPDLATDLYTIAGLVVVGTLLAVAAIWWAFR